MSGSAGPGARQAPKLEPMNKGLYVVMGVSGCGKTVIGSALARSLGVEFVEGDDFHPAENVKRMASGIALTDDDRAPWLHSIAARLRGAKDTGTGLVVSCSALKRSYRDTLRAEAGELRFIFLKGKRALIAERLAGRGGHFMPPSLLDSQFAALEEPAPEERAWECDVTESPADLVAALVARASA
jgi:gluconokinase